MWEIISINQKLIKLAKKILEQGKHEPESRGERLSGKEESPVVKKS